MQSWPPVLKRLLAGVSAKIRVRRAERGAWRGAFWGALLVVLMLGVQGWAWPVWLGHAAGFVAPAALAVLLACTLIGAAWGALRPVSPLAAARIADRAFGLKDRVTTALEWSQKATAAEAAANTPLAAAQLADTVAQAERIDAGSSGNLLPRVLPREARFLILPLAAMAALLLLPPLPAPAALMQAVAPEKAKEERAVSLLDRARMLGKDLLRRQDAVKPAPQRTQEQDQPASNPASEFKDRVMSRREGAGAMDFARFASKGDERLRLLERSEQLPDLQSDFATSQYQSMARKIQDLAAAKGGKPAEAKMKQVLKEMEKLGRKDDQAAEWSEDVDGAMQAMEDGDSEGAMEGLEDALGKMREAEDRQRASRLLQGGRDGRPDPDGGDGENSELSRGGAESGFGQGKGSGGSKGAPSARLRSSPYDAAISGMRRGRAPSFGTQSSSRPGSFSGQLQYRGEVGQYRRQMEDAIAREQVPRDYHNQIRDYFRSLQE